MKSRLIALLVALILGGCNSAGPATDAGGNTDTEAIKSTFTKTFTALELYAADHSDSYPEKLEELVPKYLDKVPNDPANQQPLGYAKSETGFLLSASAEYAKADKGFPQMDNFGFFALKASDFPSADSVD